MNHRKEMIIRNLQKLCHLQTHWHLLFFYQLLLNCSPLILDVYIIHLLKIQQVADSRA